MSREKPKKTPVDYVDNEKLYQELVVYKKAYDDAIAAGTETPRLSNYIGSCILKIAYNLSTKGQFVNYTFRQEMISDGIENCIKYVHNFDPDFVPHNPFAYVTQIVRYAFIRRIKDESYEQYKKMKELQDYQLTEQLNDNRFQIPHNDVAADFIKVFEEKVLAKKKKAAKGKKEKNKT
jgi:hypothetical protein